MALTLRTAIDETDTLLDIYGTDTLRPGQLIAVGSELMRLLGTSGLRTGDGVPTHAFWAVARQELNSTAASHSAGAGVSVPSVTGGSSVTADQQAALDAANPALSANNPVAGVALTCRLIGPFHVAFNTPGLESGARLPIGPQDLSTGTVILRAWAQVVDGDVNEGEWAGASGNITAAIGIEDSNDWDSLTDYFANQGVYGTMPTEYRTGLDNTILRIHVGVVRAGPGHLYFQAADEANGTPTQGQSDIYAIIATPAP